AFRCRAGFDLISIDWCPASAPRSSGTTQWFVASRFGYNFSRQSGFVLRTMVFFVSFSLGSDWRKIPCLSYLKLCCFAKINLAL
ncbi:MAG: hypothetical protein WAN58_15830, partial [Anaerolineales bacterium]